ncbi:amidohydrolase family protein [Corynebacterium endometrii]|uniref:2-amino-3-carboxymuconate-6-semialdehyde decarboxylase n=1 Tax=Corynebacterium endometrii TaxID=2488819 RepID=A0A4P7QER2_9CORY|nr:amidohydrolase family protein [Corynebacterium endometrii]QCB27989.1 Amidohydrolase [Corynebacterium endometrii]
MNTSPVIDIHAHFVPKGWDDLGQATGQPEKPWPWLRVDSEREAMMMVGEEEFRPITDNSWNAQLRLEEMDADQVDVQVMSPTPLFFTYEESGKTAATIARIFNDLALEIAEEGEGRLIPFCQVPLQDTAEAIKELDRCIDNGHKGVEIGNHVGDRDLDDEGIVEFLAHCAERDVPVFVHPWDMAESPRLNRWMARWLAGMPQETHLSIISLILGGAFDKLPKSLKLCFAHSGGSFPYWLGRFENAWHRRPDLIATSEHPPSHYVDRFSVDTVVFQEPSLRLLLDVMGPERVMLGSDYPYPLGETPVGNLVRGADFLTEEQTQAILGGNAQRFLGLK